jgi:hypothetical protein
MHLNEAIPCLLGPFVFPIAGIENVELRGGAALQMETLLLQAQEP